MFDRQRTQEQVASLLAGVTPILAIVSHGAIAYLLLLSMVVLLVTDWHCLIRGLHRLGPMAGVLAVFVIVTFAYQFAGAPGAVELGTKLLLVALSLIAVYGLELDAPAAHRVAKFFSCGLLIGLALYAFEWIADYPLLRAYQQSQNTNFDPSYYNRPLTYFSLLAVSLWQASCLARWFRIGASVTVAIATMGGASMAATLSICLAAVVFVIRFATKQTVGQTFGRFALISSLAYVIALPFALNALPELDEAMLTRLGPSEVQSRLHIWKYAASQTRERPGFGFGPNASESFAEQPTIERILMIKGKPVRWSTTPIQSHPHNNFVQIWLEYGSLGIVLVVLILMVIARRIDRAPGRYLQSAQLSLWVAYFVVMSTAFGAWQTDWLSLMVISLGLTRVIRDDRLATPG